MFAVLFWGLWHHVDDEERAVSQQWVKGTVGSNTTVSGVVDQLPDISQLQVSRLTWLLAIVYGVGGYTVKEAVMFKGSEQKNWCQRWRAKGLLLVGLWFYHEKLNCLNGEAGNWSEFWLWSLLFPHPSPQATSVTNLGGQNGMDIQNPCIGSWSSFPSPAEKQPGRKVVPSQTSIRGTANATPADAIMHNAGSRQKKQGKSPMSSTVRQAASS